MCRLYKTVYPHGLADEATPATSVRPSPEPSIHSVSGASTISSTSTARAGFFGRWSNAAAKAVPPSPVVNSEVLEDLILSGTAFGMHLPNLQFSHAQSDNRGRCRLWVCILSHSARLVLIFSHAVYLTLYSLFFLLRSGISLLSIFCGFLNIYLTLCVWTCRGVVGFLGFQHDRKLALQALAVAAAKSDVHSVFAGWAYVRYCLTTAH